MPICNNRKSLPQHFKYNCLEICRYVVILNGWHGICKYDGRVTKPVAKVGKLKPKVLIFSPDNEEMIKAISESASDWSVENFDSLSDLLARAARPLASQNTLLMVKISSEEAMRELCQFLAGSLDFDLILLLENEDRALAQAALAARPRMVFNTQPDPGTVSAVLEKMYPRMVQRAALLSA